MNSVTVDELVMRIEIELEKFRSQATQAENVEKRLRKSVGDGQENINKSVNKNISSILTVAKRAAAFLAVLSGSNAVQRFTVNVARANDQLGFLSRRLGMASRDVKALDTALNALGGQGASESVRSLNQGIQEMVIMGNDALIPFFSALGVGVADASGRVREMDDILLDMSDSLSRMDPQKAYAIASAMGLDDGMANALLQGRDAMRDMLDMHKSMYVSTQAEIAASRELNRVQSYLSAQWEGLKTIIGNALVPMLTKMTKVVSGWLDYLNRNERIVRDFFYGLSVAIGVVLLPLLIKAAIAMIAFLSPVLAATAAVIGLGAAFALLYNDYKTWADGGKSLFDWTAFDELIKSTDFSIEGLANKFIELTSEYKSWSQAWDSLMDWAKAKGIIDETGISIKNLTKALFDMFKSGDDIKEFWRRTIEPFKLIAEGKFSEAAKVAGIEFRTDEGSVGGFIKRTFSGSGGASGSTGGDGLLPPPELMPEFEMAAAKHNIPVSALIAMAHQESRFNANAIGPETKWGKAKGMFQYLDSTAASLGIDALDPLQAMDAAAMQIRQRLDMGESLEDAIRHHHGGPNRALWGKNNNQYAQDVMGKISAIEAMRMTRPAGVRGGDGYGAGGGVEINVGQVTVQTSATTLPEATAEGVAAGVRNANVLGDQLGSGLR